EGGWKTLPTLRGNQPATIAESPGKAQEGRIPTQACATSLDSKDGKQRAAAIRRTSGRKPSRGNGAAQRDRTYIRERICRTQLRIPVQAGSQRCAAPSGATAPKGEVLGSGRRY